MSRLFNMIRRLESKFETCLIESDSSLLFSDRLLAAT